GGSRYFQSMDNPISSSTFAGARTAVAEAIGAADDIWEKRDAPIGAPSGTKRTFLSARPPGQHDERAEAMGLWFFETIACGGQWRSPPRRVRRPGPRVGCWGVFLPGGGYDMEGLAASVAEHVSALHES